MLNKNAIIVMAAITVLGFTSAWAAGVEDKPLTVTDKTTRAECGDCHMVFPPGRLTGRAWMKIMDNLGDHFGEDASIKPKTVAYIKAYLQSKSLDAKDRYPTKLLLEQWAKRGLVDPIRITVTPNWTRHHLRKEKYKRMSKELGYTRGSNCIICHKNAERGVYEEFPGLYGLD